MRILFGETYDTAEEITRFSLIEDNLNNEAFEFINAIITDNLKYRGIIDNDPPYFRGWPHSVYEDIITMDYGSHFDFVYLDLRKGEFNMYDEEKQDVRESLYIKDFSDASRLMKILSDNGYVVMLSREEGAYMIDYINAWAYEEANRNQVLFIDRYAE